MNIWTVASSCVTQRAQLSALHCNDPKIMHSRHTHKVGCTGISCQHIGTMRYAAKRESTRRVRINTLTCVNSHALINLRKSPR
jgi:hypothetical protein